MTLYLDDQPLDLEVPTHLRSLCRIGDGEVFAYAARGSVFVRVSDHCTWAFEQDGRLVSARSGEPLAVRRGKVFYSVDDGEPLYYERAY
jgi:hypothetical protein